MRKRIASLICAAAALLSLLTGCRGDAKSASSDDGWSLVTAKSALTVGVYTDRFPMAYTNESEISGYDVDLMTEVALRLGVNAKFVSLNEKRDTADVLLNQSKIDCAIGAIPYSAELERTYLLSEPYLTDRKLLVMKQDGEMKDLADFAGKVLAMTQTMQDGSSIAESPLFLSSFASIEYPQTDEAAVNLLLDGTADAAVVKQTVADYFITNEKSICYLANDTDGVEMFGTMQYVVAFSLKNSALQKKVAEAYATMVRDGVVDALQTKWFGDIDPTHRTKSALEKAAQAAE